MSWVPGWSLRLEIGLVRQLRGQVSQGGVFGQAVDHVDPETVDAPVEPEPEHVVHGGDHFGFGPVEIGLLGQEEVQIPLAGRARPTSRSAPPKAARQLLGSRPGEPGGPEPPASSGRSSRQRYQSRLAERRDDRDSMNHGCWSLLWLGTQSTRTRMSRRVRLGDESIEVGQGPEDRVDVAVVRNVVAEVGHGRSVEGRHPHGVDPQPDQVVEVPADPLEVADAVAAGVAE